MLKRSILDIIAIVIWYAYVTLNIDLEINCHMFVKIVNNVGDHNKLKAMKTLKVDRPNGHILFPLVYFLNVHIKNNFLKDH